MRISCTARRKLFGSAITVAWLALIATAPAWPRYSKTLDLALVALSCVYLTLFSVLLLCERVRSGRARHESFLCRWRRWTTDSSLS